MWFILLSRALKAYTKCEQVKRISTEGACFLRLIFLSSLIFFLFLLSDSRPRLELQKPVYPGLVP